MYTAGGNMIWHIHFREQFDNTIKIKDDSEISFKVNALEKPWYKCTRILLWTFVKIENHLNVREEETEVIKLVYTHTWK